MKRLISTLCATALTAALAITSFAPAQAAPIVVPAAPSAPSDVVNAQSREHWNRDGWRSNGWRRDGWRRDNYRNGWRRHGGYYRNNDRNLGGAIVGGLITGAIVGTVLNNSRPVYRERVYRGGNAHIQWCYDRYQTYRASDNTYVPRVGQRAYCNSPYN